MLNLNRGGILFAKITRGRGSNQRVSAPDKPNAGFKYLGIANDANFQLMPNPKTEREVLYITSPSRSGKSTFARKYLEHYKKTFEDNPICLFSSLPNDESLDDIEPKRVRLDESIYKGPIPRIELASSVVILDDVDVVSDKKN